MNSSKSSEKPCWRCSFLAWKHRRWKDLDWLFVTTSPQCAQHRDAPARDVQDLADAFLTYDRARTEMISVRQEEARKILYDLAKRWEADVDGLALVQRDKAKTITGLSSLAFTLMTVGAGYVSGPASAFPRWLFGMEAVLLLMVALHLVRALQIALQVMTAEDVARPSMQDYVRSLSLGEDPKEKKQGQLHLVRAFQVVLHLLGGTKIDRSLAQELGPPRTEGQAKKSDPGRMYLELAAHTVSAANQRHKRLLPRINSMVVAKTSFGYGVYYMVALMVLHLTGTIFSNKTQASSIASSGTLSDPNAPSANAGQPDAGVAVLIQDGGTVPPDGGLPPMSSVNMASDGGIGGGRDAGRFLLDGGSDAGSLLLDGGIRGAP